VELKTKDGPGDDQLIPYEKREAGEPRGQEQVQGKRRRDPNTVKVGNRHTRHSSILLDRSRSCRGCDPTRYLTSPPSELLGELE
jgi:hypothetical protein